MTAKAKLIHPTHPQIWNHRAHEVVQALFDAVEDNLVRSGKCRCDEADEFLTMTFIEQQASLHGNCVVYTESDARSVAGIFLHYLAKGAKAPLRDRYERRRAECDAQLQWHQPYYFQDYYGCLQRVSILALRRVTSLSEMNQNGVFKVAAANLPNFKDDLRRTCRRMDEDFEKTFVFDEEVNKRSNISSKLIRDGTNIDF